MAFFSYERILRGVLTWRQAVVFAALLCLLSAFVIFTLDRSGSLNFRTAVSIFVCVPLMLAALIDSVCHILPDPLLLLGAAIALVSMIFSPWSEIGRAALSAGIFLVIGVIISHMTSLGRGDAKLMGVMGVWLGSMHLVFLALVCAMAGAALFALILLLAKRAQLTTSIALGPWLVVGGFLAYLFACISG